MNKIICLLFILIVFYEINATNLNNSNAIFVLKSVTNNDYSICNVNLGTEELSLTRLYSHRWENSISIDYNLQKKKIAVGTAIYSNEDLFGKNSLYPLLILEDNEKSFKVVDKIMDNDKKIIDVRFSGSGKFLYVDYIKTSAYKKYDLENKKFSGLIKVHVFPKVQDKELSPDDNYLYVANYYRKKDKTGKKIKDRVKKFKIFDLKSNKEIDYKKNKQLDKKEIPSWSKKKFPLLSFDFNMQKCDLIDKNTGICIKTIDLNKILYPYLTVQYYECNNIKIIPNNNNLIFVSSRRTNKFFIVNWKSEKIVKIIDLKDNYIKSNIVLYEETKKEK